jgi:hypothetical protein
MKNTKGVTKRTWNKKAKEFAKKSTSAWKDLNTFVQSKCKPEEAEKFRDELCDLVDKYVELNCDIHIWCRKNGVDTSDFMCDVNNLGYDGITEDGVNE